MPSTYALARFALLALVAALAVPVPAQEKSKEDRLKQDELGALMKAVDAVAAGQPGGGGAWLKWSCHFLRSAAGKTYVPFTVTIDEAPNAFKENGVYIRVTPRGTATAGPREEAHVQNVIGVATGEVPVSVPERQFGPPGAPTAGENSVVLRSLAAALKQPPPAQKYPFEGTYIVEVEKSNGPPRFQRALVIEPGEYDVYLAIRERSVRRGTEPKLAVMKQPLTVPDFTESGLRTSSVIVLDRPPGLTSPLSESQQSARPYALGTMELFPAFDTTWAKDESLALAFFIYNAAADASGKPNVTVEYRLHVQSGPSEKLLGATAPQEFSPATLPPTFDLRAGHLLAAEYALPLATFAPGSYRLEITVTDRSAKLTATEDVLFTIEG